MAPMTDRSTNTGSDAVDKPVLDTLHFLGDSHLRVPRAAYEAGLFGKTPCVFELVRGATAVGLRHPTSKTQALVQYRSSLLPYRRGVIPIFHIGEVDCGFVIWLRAQRRGESVDAQLLASISAYRAFLREIKAAGYCPIATSATLPTLQDGALEGEISLLRAKVKASYRERTDLTLRYNEMLRAGCVEDGIDYLDFTPDFIDTETRLLNEWFRHPDRNDHHLHPERAGAIWVARVLDFVRRRVPSAPRKTSLFRRWLRILGY